MSSLGSSGRRLKGKELALGATEGLQMESPMSQDQRVVDSPEPLSGAQLEHNTSAGGELESLTPQKKLLNSIVKSIMEELGKLKRTPSARKAEREKRVGTLMSMR
ncbi:hypothetical protein Pint_18638 [Pistacia integerrima]|uniref:Uncharacterized protein n=1 Tax=Pistacia integerrima TaxID=434235 RepID=A0ACC0YY37_9ROSI|nr:hypothetical protein Pint_18638 [Pistacia integerrima]